MILSSILETMTSLKRDRIFLPGIISSFAMLFLISIISEFTIEEMITVFYNGSLTLINLTGSIVAIMWGATLIPVSRSDASIDLQLISPISRYQWIMGKSLGLFSTLIIYATILFTIWSGLLFINGYTKPEIAHTYIFIGFISGWMVLASCSILFTTLSTHTMSVFSTICLWIIGLSASPLSLIVSDRTPKISKYAIDFLKNVWNFQIFDLTAFAATPSQIDPLDVVKIVCYGASLVAVLLSLTSLIFSKKDMN